MIGLFYNYYIFFQDLDPHFAYAAKVKNLLNEKKVFSYHPITLRYNKPNFTLGGGGYAVPLITCCFKQRKNINFHIVGF